MRNKTLFIPVLLLLIAIQPNKILSADNRFDQAADELEWLSNESAHPVGIEGIYRSNNPEVNQLLKKSREKALTWIELFQHRKVMNVDPNLTYHYGLDIIDKHYPNEDLLIAPFTAEQKYNTIAKKIDQYKESGATGRERRLGTLDPGQSYVSDDSNVQELLDNCYELIDDRRDYSFGCIAIIKENYPGVTIEVESFGAGIKG